MSTTCVNYVEKFTFIVSPEPRVYYYIITMRYGLTRTYIIYIYSYKRVHCTCSFSFFFTFLLPNSGVISARQTLYEI